MVDVLMRTTKPNVQNLKECALALKHTEQPKKKNNRPGSKFLYYLKLKTQKYILWLYMNSAILYYSIGVILTFAILIVLKITSKLCTPNLKVTIVVTTFCQGKTMIIFSNE